MRLYEIISGLDYHCFGLETMVTKATDEEIAKSAFRGDEDDRDHLFTGICTHSGERIVQSLLPHHYEDTTMDIEEQIFAELNDNMSETPDIEELEVEEDLPELDCGEREELSSGKHRTMKPFSVVFGWKPTSVPDFMVATFEGFESEPVPDPYIPPKSQIEQFVFYSERGGKCNLVGPTGAGKTLMAEFYAAMTGRPFLRVEHNEELDKASVFGQVHITNGDTDFVPGVLAAAMAEPTVVVLDEFSRSPCHANMIYQRVFDRWELFLPEMKDGKLAAVKPVEGFIICATDNTKGDGEDTDLYPASNVQDSALRNRFDALIEVPYASQAEERALIKHLLHGKTVPASVITGLAQFSFLLHQGFEDRTISTAFSPRQLINICADLRAGLTIDQSIKPVYVNFCSKSEMSDILETFRTAFGREL